MNQHNQDDADDVQPELIKKTIKEEEEGNKMHILMNGTSYSGELSYQPENLLLLDEDK